MRKSRSKENKGVHIHPKDLEALQKVKDSGATKPILVLNKIDDSPTKTYLLPTDQEWAAQDVFTDIIPVSAHKKDNLDQLLTILKKGTAAG